MRLPQLIFVIVVLASTAATAGPAPAGPVLPQQFGGWTSASPQVSTDPAVADPVNAAVLKEYGFTDFESAAYTRDDGRKLTIKAARFTDASGAYGAFTFYKVPAMLSEKIGDQAVSANERVLFYRGNILIDAVFSKLSAMSAAELRELADGLPLPGGNTRNLPGLPIYLPKQSYIKNTAKYILGPATLEKIGAPISTDVVDFSAGAEVVLGNYASSGGDATLMLISYPTPQIAAEHLRRIDAAHQPNPQAPDAAPHHSDTIFDKRTGPIVVIASGPLSSSEAKSLLASVNYEADVTWNQDTYLTKKNNLANLLVNVILLCVILVGLMLVAGLAFGGIRIFLRGLISEKLLDRKGDLDFISLDLAKAAAPPPESKVSPSIKAG
jgi:uncharacterized protein DUF6599